MHSANPSLTTAATFVQHCLELVSNDTSNLRQRLTACAYLASFIARGSHISSKAISEIFNVLCHYLDDMRRRYEPNCSGPDRRHYALYYAVAQAVVYIFCFRWRDLVVGSTTPEQDSEEFDEDEILAEGRDLAWQPGVKDVMHRNIYSKLNPLKVCSPDIVSEFARIAHHLRFLYVFSLIESNKRVRLAQTGSYYGSSGLTDIGRRETAYDCKKGEAHHQLEAYFPFDPYNLPKSKRWVANDYNAWKLPAGLRDDDDDDEEGSEENEEEEVSEAEDVSDEEVDYPAATTVAMRT